MRKLIAGLLALSALSPVAAAAQDGPGGWAGRAERSGMQPERERGVDDDRRPGPRAERRIDDDRRDDPAPFNARIDARADVRADAGPRGDDRRPDRAPDRARTAPDGPPQGVRGRFDRDDRRGPAPGGWTPAPRFDGDAGVRGRADWDRAPRREDRADRDRDGRVDRYRDDWTRSRLDRRDDGWTRSRFDDRAGWNRDWRGDRRYDWNRYRTADRGAYRLPRYYAPPGWSRGYRRFGIGVGLQASLWSRNYWIADPYSYRLPEAYGPYRWVRYYDDALLIDLRSGIVVDAVYGIFW